MPTRILVPPGIGDIYWVTVKLKSFLEKNNLTDPEITVVSYFDSLEAHLRGIEFLEMFPDIKIGDPQCVENDPELQQIWQEAYLGPGKSIFPGVMGYDYLIAYNGVINSGGWLETCDEYECDWNPIQILPDIWTAKHAFEASEYMLCFFPFIGTYSPHERDFPIALLAESINRFTALTGITPVFIGGKTEQAVDRNRYEMLYRTEGAVDLVGQTSLKEVFRLIAGAECVLGYHSGIPNLAAACGKKTLLLWDDRFPLSTCYACAPPAVRGGTYIARQTKGMTVNSLVQYLENLCRI